MAVALFRNLRYVLCAALLAGGLAFEVLLVMSAEAQAAPDPRPVAQAASSTDDFRTLGQQVESVLAEARRQQALLNVQRQRLAAAESANAWMPMLFMAVAALALLCVVLGLRVWRLQRQLAQRPAAAQAVASKPASQVGDAGNASGEPDRPPVRPLLGGLVAAPMRKPLDRSPLPARPSAALGELGTSGREFSFGSGVPPRPVSVEELLDLDQQVEFFLALGQAQSAIDLLLGHVRSTGGTNAQPYFKLLEIYRDQGDEEAYERTSERFNQRFNALAPGWTGNLASGRLLEEYPDVVQRLQRAWPQPARAVAELEGLLLRRADLEPFDMPAYHDVLMLHALARDLPIGALAEADLAEAPAPPSAQPTTPAVLARERPPEPAPPVAIVPAAVTTVDLLLPLGEQAMDITLPQPHLAERPPVQAMLADWVFTRSGSTQGADDGAWLDPDADPPSTSMVLDLDLSEHAPAPREFTRPAAFTDIDLRHDHRLSDLGGLDDADPVPSKR